MKLSKKTLEILENFSTINKSICINEIGCLKTISSAKNIVAVCKIEEELPEFSIYDLNEFVSVVKMFNTNKDIEFVFTEKEVIIKQGKTKVNYKFCNPDHIFNKCDLYEKYTKNTDYNASFKFTETEMNNTIKASRVMDLKTMNISINEEKGEVSLYDSDNSAANQYRIEIEGSGECDVDIDVSLMNFIKGDYDVYVFERYTKFVSGDLTYIVFNSNKG